MLIRIKPLLLSIVLALAVGGVSALVTMPAMDLYRSLNQPPLAPPGWVFPVVWSILFILMGISAYLVYDSNASDRSKRVALSVYALNLVMNFLWSVLFFGFQQYLLAFLWLILLWIVILIMIILFFRIQPLAGYLQIPYLLWVTFAGYLNCAIFLLNA